MDQAAKENEYIENVRIANDQSKPLTIVFEPWHSIFEIPPGDNVIVSSRGPVGDGIEVTIGDGMCTVWGWPGSATVVVHKGEVVIDWRELSVPAMPVPSMREIGEELWADVTEAEFD